MPLHVRPRKDHYPHDERSPRLDHYVVLSGDLEVGSFHRNGSGPSEGRWSWAHAIGTDDTAFAADGYAAYPEVCRTLITLAFRRTLARGPERAGRKARAAEPRAAGRDRRAFAADAGLRSRDRSLARDGSQRTARFRPLR